MATSETSSHIVTSFDDELKELKNSILRMGGMAETQLASAIQAVTRMDNHLAEQVIAGDKKIDELDEQVTALCTRMLALRQPMAVDLRAVLTSLKISGGLERIGDLAKNLAKRSLALNHRPPPAEIFGFKRMARLVEAMIKDVLDAYAEQDLEKAVDVWRRDEEVDALYNSLFRELLTYMMEDPRTITAGTHLMFMAKNIERMGDHATNIAEDVHYMISGDSIEDERPKNDLTSSISEVADGDSDGNV